MISYEDTQEANADEARDYAHELRQEAQSAKNADVRADVSVSIEEAKTMIAAAAITETPDPDYPTEDAPRTLIHTFAHGGGMMLGADWDLAPALEFVAKAEQIEWVDHPIGHDLGVLAEGRAIFFDVKRPVPA